MHRVSQATIINTITSGTQDSTWYLWESCLLFWVFQSKSQSGTMLVKEGKQTAKDFTLIQSTEIHKEKAWQDVLSRREIHFHLMNLGRALSRTLLTSISADVGKNVEEKLKLLIPLNSYARCVSVNKVTTWFFCCKWMNLRPFQDNREGFAYKKDVWLWKRPWPIFSYSVITKAPSVSQSCLSNNIHTPLINCLGASKSSCSSRLIV